MQDYIMKIIEQLVEAILVITKLRKKGAYKEAREKIRTSARYLLKTDIDLLLFYEDELILNQFNNATNLDTEKCILIADLFYELALIEEAENKHAEALRLKMLCMYLYTTSLPKEKQFQKADYFEKVSYLIEELQNKPLSEKAKISLNNYKIFIDRLKLKTL